MNAVFDGFKGTALEKLIMLKLADAAGDDGCDIYPSQQTIATACNCSRRQVSRIMRNLEEQGYIVRQKQNPQIRTIKWKLALDRLKKVAPYNCDNMSHHCDTQMAHQNGKTGETNCLTSETSTTSECDIAVSYKPSLNQNNNKPRQLRTTAAVNSGHPQTVNAAMDLAQTKPITASHIEHLQKHPTPPSTGDDLKHDLLMLGIPAPPTANTADLLSIHHLRAATIRERLAIQQAQHQEAKA